MKGSFFVCNVFILGVISLTSGQQSRLIRRLDSVERKLDGVLLDMMNFRTDIKDIHTTFSQNQSSTSCSCTGEDSAMQEHVDAEKPKMDTDHSKLGTLAANTDRIQMIYMYKGFQDLKGTVRVATATHSSKIKGVEEKFEEIEQKIEAIVRLNNDHVDNLKQVNHRVKSLESEIKLLRRNNDQTDKLHQLEANTKMDMEDTIRATMTDMEQRLPIFCPRGWFQFLNYCFYLSNAKASWHNAISFCKTKQAQLIDYTSNDKVEQNFVLLFVRSFYTWSSKWDGYFIGGSDIRTEGKIVWESSQEPILNSNWYTKQPDNYRNSEDCIVALVNQNGLWNDDSCEGLRYFVCKKKLLHA